MFNALQSLRSMPIPPRESARAAIKGYRDWPIRPCGERLTPASDYGIDGENYYAQTRNPPYWCRIEGAIDALLVREGVGERLSKVNARLADAGLKLFLHDAWRPRAVQEYFHDVWMPAEVRKRHPDWDAASVIAEVERYWAAPSQSAARPAPHATGGAVDITLVWDDGRPLWMGSLFDDASALSHTDRFERETEDRSFSDEEARDNRRLLYWAMNEQGFASLPNEWWHFSYGDQLWAKMTGADAAIYGEIAP